jgi:hypothetical protein
MQINLVSCIFVLDSKKNDNIRKNDVKKLKVLVNNNNELPTISIEGNEIKKQVRNSISSIIGSNIFHLEQVYTMDYKSDIDIIYLGVTNIDNISELKEDYKLVGFEIKDNSLIILDNKEYEYKTIELEDNNNIEYIHDIRIKNEQIKRTLMNLLISYKRIRNSIDSTDIVFKFMGSSFTLEDVRIVYELIKDCSVDKSNFRKKIIKYCEKVDSTTNEKNGYRPSQRYKFKPLKGDVWL